MNFLETLKTMEYFGNSLYDYGLSLVVFFLALIILKIFKNFIIAKILKLSAKTETKLDDMLVEAINVIRWPFYVLVSVYISINFLALPEIITKIVYIFLLISVIYYAIRLAERMIDFGAEKILESKKEEDQNLEIIRLLSSVLKIVLWAGAVVLLLANMGYNVTSLIAGLGIGGIAVALALQNILSDLLSSISIYFDKPFKVGDFVVVSGYAGTIKRIGIKSTRIQSLQGEEVVMSNNELTQAQIQNFGIMERRRVVLPLGVIYQTKSEQLRKIPEVLKDIINKVDGATFDRSHFKSYGDSALNFETIYYIESADYNEYMDIQEKVNLDIFEAFEKEKIEFAYPTQTLFVEK